MPDVAAAAEYGACAVCRMSVPKHLLAKQRGRCEAHIDEGEPGTGCAECGHPTFHYRDCAWCE